MLLAIIVVVAVVVVDVGSLKDDGLAESKTLSKRQSRPPVQCASNNAKYSYNKNAYNGPYNWPSMSMCCGGEWQSPVNILPSRAMCGQTFRISYSGYPIRIQGTLYNTGHSAEVEFDPRPQLLLSGVPYSIGSDFVLGEMHYHAGNIHESGSEHFINGRGYAGELHLVHFNQKYGSMKAASTKPDGLAVIGIFLEQSNFSPNTELNRYISGISRLNGMMGQKIPISLDPRTLVPFDGKFYTYHGSLTTPPCSESARWIVMDTPLKTTFENLRVLRMLLTDEGVPTAVHTNVRPHLPLGTRKLEANFNCFG